MNPIRLLTPLLLAITLLPCPVYADQESQGKELTGIFRAARKVISDNQELINDASKGNKGLSADKVLDTMKSNYKTAIGAELNMGGEGAEAKTAMVKAIRDVMNDAQALINESGKGFKGFLPAVFAGRVANKFSADMDGKYKIKLTAPKAYVRNRANRPDEWESTVIESKFKNASWAKGAPFAETTPVNGKPAYRVILPEYYGESCLKCHGNPKGDTDITGGTKEGAELNELGGAISLIIFK